MRPSSNFRSTNLAKTNWDSRETVAKVDQISGIKLAAVRLSINVVVVSASLVVEPSYTSCGPASENAIFYLLKNWSSIVSAWFCKSASLMPG